MVGGIGVPGRFSSQNLAAGVVTAVVAQAGAAMAATMIRRSAGGCIMRDASSTSAARRGDQSRAWEEKRARARARNEKEAVGTRRLLPLA